MKRTGFLLVLLALSRLSAQDGGDNWESYYHNGELAEETQSDKFDRPLKTRIYHRGVLQEARTYTYDEGSIIIDVIQYNPDGTENAWQENLSLREDGSLRIMGKSGQDSQVLNGWSSLAEWTRSGEGEEILTYGSGGELLKRTVSRGDELIEKELFSYGDEGLLLSSELIRLPEKTEEITRYDNRELPVEVLFYRDSLLVRQVFYTYNERGFLLTEESRGGGLLAERALEYDGNDVLREDRYYQNGLISRRITYNGEEKTEEIYKKGILTLRVKYRGSEIIGEEKIQ